MLFEETVSMVKVNLRSYLYKQHITIKTKYAVIQFSSIQCLFFAPKNALELKPQIT